MPEQAEAHRYEDLARTALLEITSAATIGDYAGEQDEGDGAVSVLFESSMPGYPGWQWTVSIAQVEGSEPTVLEAELMPADGALLAPDWVPWSDRLADYKAAQEAAEGTGAETDELDDADEDDDLADEDSDDEDDDLEDDDLDEDSDEDPDEDDILGNDVLHGGDLDGVDIDDLDEESDDDEDDEDDDFDDEDEQEKSY
jgi:hypothetical protein